MSDQNSDLYLKPTAIMDSDHPAVQAYARETVGDAADPVQRAVRLYLAVRDDIRYDPYAPFYLPEHYQASKVLKGRRSFCIPKAALLCTLGRTVGLPAAVYTDSHGIFVRNDPHWTVAEELQGYQNLTQVGQALQALGIHHIVVESPQAKGRVERLWNTFQDRLVAELRLAGITTMAAGNAFLVTTFLPAFNAQFAVPAAVAPNAYRPGPRGWDLDRICAFHYARQVAADNTVRVEQVVLQLAPGPQRRSYARAHADVVPCLDGSWRVYVGDRLIATTPAPPDPGQLRARRRR